MNIAQPFITLYTYYDYYCKYRRIKSDWNRAVAEWNRIGGINASTGLLLNFANDYSLILVEYATWTTWTTLDDEAMAMVRYVLVVRRDTLINMIDWVRRGHEPNTTELLALTESACTSPTALSPLTILSILLAIYQTLQHLKKQNTVPPTPEPTPEPPERKRPVITFIRKIFGKQ